MVSLFGQEPAGNIYKFEISEDDKTRIKKTAKISGFMGF